MKDPKIVSEKAAQWMVLAELELKPFGDLEARADEAVDAVTAAVQSLDLLKTHLERLQAAVLRTCVRALEMGAGQAPPRPVVLRTLASQTLDPSQGWGFFLIERRAEGRASAEQPGGNGLDGDLCIQPCVIIELFLYREGDRLLQGRGSAVVG